MCVCFIYSMFRLQPPGCSPTPAPELTSHPFFTGSPNNTQSTSGSISPPQIMGYQPPDPDHWSNHHILEDKAFVIAASHLWNSTFKKQPKTNDIYPSLSLISEDLVLFQALRASCKHCYLEQEKTMTKAVKQNQKWFKIQLQLKGLFPCISSLYSLLNIQQQHSAFVVWAVYKQIRWFNFFFMWILKFVLCL